MELVLVIHNVRSAHNVGSLFRTADGLGVSRVLLTGYTPYPRHKADERAPHVADKTGRAIHKTALGAEDSVAWQRQADIVVCLHGLKSKGFQVIALEQTTGSINLKEFRGGKRLVLVVGNEVDGLEDEVLKTADHIIEIPMKGKKESLNVAVAAAVAIYRLLSM